MHLFFHRRTGAVNGHHHQLSQCQAPMPPATLHPIRIAAVVGSGDKKPANCASNLAILAFLKSFWVIPLATSIHNQHYLAFVEAL